MKIIFCSTAINALGETYSIATFALELIKKGHECYFIAPVLGKRYLLTFGFDEKNILVLKGSLREDKQILKTNYTLFSDYLNGICPDCVIVADWHEFKPNGNSNNNSYSIHWFSKSIPLGTFDHYGFAPEGEKLELFINGYKTEKIITPTYELYSFIIRPSPPHEDNTITENNVHYWYYNNLKESRNGYNKQELKFEITGSLNRLILHPIGLWQERASERIFKRLEIKENYYKDIFLPIIFHYLSKFEETFTYVIVSGSVKKEKKEKFNNINIIWKPPLGNKEFTNLLKSSDLLFTDNLMSSNISKALFYNVLPIVFVSSVRQENDEKIISKFEIADNFKKKTDLLLKRNILFPYVSFPMGLNEILKNYKDNSFSSCFLKTELLDDASTSNMLKQVFSDNKLLNEIIENQKGYIKKKRSLPDAENILLKIMEKK